MSTAMQKLVMQALYQDYALIVRPPYEPSLQTVPNTGSSWPQPERLKTLWAGSGE
jgi:hypothetical protein